MISPRLQVVAVSNFILTRGEDHDDGGNGQDDIPREGRTIATMLRSISSHLLRHPMLSSIFTAAVLLNES